VVVRKFSFYFVGALEVIQLQRKLNFSCSVFTALHGMQTQSSDENSVRASVKRLHCDKKEERSVQDVQPSLPRRMVGGWLRRQDERVMYR